MKILVTGSNGFVGRVLTAALETQGHQVVRVVRNATYSEGIAVGDINAHTQWSNILSEMDAVVHLAARVHDVKQSADQLAAYRVTNTEGTRALAQAAQQANVKRFIFISSVKALGEGKKEPYRETDASEAEDAYGISKWEAEQALHAMTGDMEKVIIRPPLVYGPGVGANFLRLLKLANSGLPLPLGGINNQRSMIYIGNLVDAIMRCLTHPAAGGHIFMVSDGKSVSTSILFRILASYMPKPARLFSVPTWILECAGRLLGRQADIQRLFGSLLVDDTAIRTKLEWQPPYTCEQGLQETAAWFLTQEADSVS